MGTVSDASSVRRERRRDAGCCLPTPPHPNGNTRVAVATSNWLAVRLSRRDQPSRFASLRATMALRRSATNDGFLTTPGGAAPNNAVSKTDMATALATFRNVTGGLASPSGAKEGLTSNLATIRAASALTSVVTRSAKVANVKTPAQRDISFLGTDLSVSSSSSFASSPVCSVFVTQAFRGILPPLPILRISARVPIPTSTRLTTVPPALRSQR